MEEPSPDSPPSSDAQDGDGRCCCGAMHIKRAADVVMSLSSFLIIINLIMKATGHSDTGWNWELLFLVVDSAAVVGLCYGIRTEHAAFLQPFVVLSIVTINFLILLTLFFLSAVLDAHSYAGEYLEMELRENVQAFAQGLSVHQKTVVPLIAAVLTIGTAATVALNCWFLHIVVQCATQFRLKDFLEKDCVSHMKEACEEIVEVRSRGDHEV